MTSSDQELKKLCASNEAISEAQILCNLPHELHEEWDNFMRGKTCPILDNGEYGAYSWDLKQFLSKI
jgi:hypothetical protein